MLLMMFDRHEKLDTRNIDKVAQCQYIESCSRWSYRLVLSPHAAEVS